MVSRLLTQSLKSRSNHMRLASPSCQWFRSLLQKQRPCSHLLRRGHRMLSHRKGVERDKTGSGPTQREKENPKPRPTPRFPVKSELQEEQPRRLMATQSVLIIRSGSARRWLQMAAVARATTCVAFAMVPIACWTTGRIDYMTSMPEKESFTSVQMSLSNSYRLQRPTRQVFQTSSNPQLLLTKGVQYQLTLMMVREIHAIFLMLHISPSMTSMTQTRSRLKACFLDHII